MLAITQVEKAPSSIADGADMIVFIECLLCVSYSTIPLGAKDTPVEPKDMILMVTWL